MLARVGASIDGPAQYQHLSATRNLEVHARLLDLPPAEVARVLDVVGLAGTGRQRVRTFSTGMRGRLALAVALLGDPELVVLDEPQNGLDPEGVVAGLGSHPWRRLRLTAHRGRLLGRAGDGGADRVEGRAVYRARRPVRLPSAWRTTGPTAALVTSLRGTATLPLMLAAAGTVPLGLFVWPDADYTRQLVELLLPVGGDLIARPDLAGKRQRLTRPQPPSPPRGRAHCTPCSRQHQHRRRLAFYCALALRVAGTPWTASVELAALATTTGTALILWHLWLAIRWHIAVALAAGAVGTLLAPVVGGTGLANQHVTVPDGLVAVLPMGRCLPWRGSARSALIAL